MGDFHFCSSLHLSLCDYFISFQFSFLSSSESSSTVFQSFSSEFSFLHLIWKVEFRFLQSMNTGNGLNEDFSPKIRCQRWYNQRRVAMVTGYLNETSNRLIGWVSMGPLRVKQSRCVKEGIVCFFMLFRLSFID